MTTTALSNLLGTVGKDELANVCVVISDLKTTYAGGSAQINRALEDLRSELGRSALTLEPVGMNTDEIYHILRKRLFETLPDDAEILQVVRTYAQAVRDAKQMDITSASPEKFTQLLRESYPFHFAIREVVRTDEVQLGKNWLRTEVSNYWQQRKILIEILRYFSTMGLMVSHWRDEARAAQLLAGAVENDSV